MTPAGRERADTRTGLLLASVAAWTLLIAMGHAAGSATDWVLMVVAMMAPLLTAPVGHVRARSFAGRRARSVGLFLAGYFLVWTVTGLALTAIAAVLATALPEGRAVVVAVAAAAWQCAPVKQRSLNRIRTHPELAAFGAAADRGALRFGYTHGCWCVASCWALMLLAVVVPHGTAGLATMLGLTMWFAAERLDRPRHPDWRLRLPRTAARLAVARLTSVIRAAPTPVAAGSPRSGRRPPGPSLR